MTRYDKTMPTDQGMPTDQNKVQTYLSTSPMLSPPHPFFFGYWHLRHQWLQCLDRRYPANTFPCLVCQPPTCPNAWRDRLFLLANISCAESSPLFFAHWHLYHQWLHCWDHHYPANMFLCLVCWPLHASMHRQTGSFRGLSCHLSLTCGQECKPLPTPMLLPTGQERGMSKNVLWIHGTTNQHVKEYNHIETMRDQLGVSFNCEHGIVNWCLYSQVWIWTDKFDSGIVTYGQPIACFR